MGDKTRKVPNPEWVLMYRRGLTASRIARLVAAPPSKVGYHLAVARSIEPGLLLEHEALVPDSPGARVTASGIARMNQLVEFVTREGRYPSYSATSPEERKLAAWLRRRRRNQAAGNLAPVISEALQALPGWEANTRTLIDESRWQERITALVAYRAAGKDWPRHKKTDGDEERVLGVWLHFQRCKLRRGELDATRAATLDDVVPGWREGRRRGRKASSK